MGFRSTVAFQFYDIKWPLWIADKYKNILQFKENGDVLCLKEAKTYSSAGYKDLATDIQKAIDWKDFGLDLFVFVFLHECGGITRFSIYQDKIVISEPTSWDKVDFISHHYCTMCGEI